MLLAKTGNEEMRAFNAHLHVNASETAPVHSIIRSLRER